jgi:hypothetical protein
MTGEPSGPSMAVVCSVVLVENLSRLVGQDGVGTEGAGRTQDRKQAVFTQLQRDLGMDPQSLGDQSGGRESQ